MPWLAAAIGAASSLVYGLIQNNQNKKESRRAERRQDRLIVEQNEYNAPKQQMARFHDAGLNPNLMYGQGTHGNFSGGVPETPRTTYQNLDPDVLGKAQQLTTMELQKSQIDLNNQKVDESGAKKDLMDAQRELIKAHPNLNPAIVKSMVSSFESAAKVKAQEAAFLTGSTNQTSPTNGWMKMNAELQNILERNGLISGQKDLQDVDLNIRSEVLNSKRFQNELLEVQAKFMKDGDISSGQILDFVKMLLLKLAGN